MEAIVNFKNFVKRISLLRRLALFFLRKKNASIVYRLNKIFVTALHCRLYLSQFPKIPEVETKILVFSEFSILDSFIENGMGCNYFLVCTDKTGHSSDYAEIIKRFRPSIIGLLTVSGSSEFLVDTLKNISMAKIIDLTELNGKV
jgi:hypothetical protein